MWNARDTCRPAYQFTLLFIVSKGVHNYFSIISINLQVNKFGNH